MKIRAFWDVAPCSLGVDRRFRGAYCLHHQGVDRWRQYAPLKRRSTSTRLHGATSQMTTLFVRKVGVNCLDEKFLWRHLFHREARERHRSINLERILCVESSGSTSQQCLLRSATRYGSTVRTDYVGFRTSE